MDPLWHFIRYGVVGEIRLGMERRELEIKLGSPETWLGKPPTFGPVVLTPHEAEAWCYYERAVSVGFNGQGVINAVNIFPEHIKSRREPFQHLPIGPGLTMGEVRDLLVNSSMDFDEGEDNEPGGYYILAQRRCTAMSIGRYSGGKLIPERKRLVAMINTVSSEDELPSFVLRYWTHDRKPSDENGSG